MIADSKFALTIYYFGYDRDSIPNRNPMTIKNLPQAERPRRKLLQLGVTSLSNAELLAILIGSGRQGCSALDIGHQLIKDWPSLNELVNADLNQLRTCHGVSQVFYCRLQASMELASRCLQETLQRETTIENPATTRRFLISRLRHLNHEVFAVLFLDNAHRLIQYEVLFEGTINGASVYPRRVLERAMKWNAAAVILAHNHPSGIAEPSQADEQITQTLVKTLSFVDVRVLDHIIIGANNAISLAERGLL